MTASLPGRPIDIPLPPELVEALGYTGNARFVSFRYVYDDLTYSDGISSGSANGWTFQAYARHRAVAPLLDPHDLGGADHEAPFVLLIDRERNRATIAKADEARAFLLAQWPPEPPATEEQRAAHRREMDQILKEMAARPIDHDAIARGMAEQRSRLGRLMSWLDMCPVPKELGQTP